MCHNMFDCLPQEMLERIFDESALNCVKALGRCSVRLLDSVEHYCKSKRFVLNILRILNESFGWEMDVLWDLQCYGVIAGGSIVYATCDFVAKSSVGDIDLFVSSEEYALEALKYLIDRFPEYTLKTNCTELDEGVSIIAFHHNERIPIQIICKKFINPLDLIESFDIDYVQCGVNQDKFYQTTRCQTSHDTKYVRYSRGKCFRNGRFQKAILKGFSAPILSFEKRAKSTYNDISAENVFFREMSREHDAYALHNSKDEWLDLETAKIVGISRDNRFKIRCMSEKGKECTAFPPCATLNLFMKHHDKRHIDFEEKVCLKYAHGSYNPFNDRECFPRGPGIFTLSVGYNTRKGLVWKRYNVGGKVRAIPVVGSIQSWTKIADKITFEYIKHKYIRMLRDDDPIESHIISILRRLVYYVEDEKMSIDAAATKAFSKLYFSNLARITSLDSLVDHLGIKYLEI